jgi:hypothetical protein
MRRDIFDNDVCGLVRAAGETLRKKYECEAQIEWVMGWENALFKAYSDLRDMIREDMSATDKARIDRHKIAAALTSMSVLRRFSGYEFYRKNPRDTERRKALGFSWPVTRETQGTCILQFVKELLQPGQYNRREVYLLANIYFMLEAYHLLVLGLPPISFVHA